MFGGAELRIVLDVLREVDFFGNPEVVHRLTVPVADPGVAHVVEVVEVGRIAANHSSEAEIGIARRVEERVFVKGLLLHERVWVVV